MLSSTMPQKSDPYEYVLYIDEAGDDGLKRVRPIDPVGGSEWLCIGAVLVRVSNENNVVDWVREIRQSVGSRQGPALHYRNLTSDKRVSTCELLAQKEVVCFAVCSNKKNMRGWSNERAAIKGGKQWFYNFCVRFLMERVTDLCLRDSMKRYGAPRYLKVVFSQRGGHYYGQTKAYWEVLKNQAAGGTTFLAKREIRHKVLRYSLVDAVPHIQNAGLQLADVVASAFFSAVDTIDGMQDVNPAKALKSKMARETGVIADFGVVLQPTPPSKAKLNNHQKLIFEHYGYEF
jgi:hypothetical protein